MQSSRPKGWALLRLKTAGIFLNGEYNISILIFVQNIIHSFLHHKNSKPADTPLLCGNRGIRFLTGQRIIERVAVKEAKDCNIRFAVRTEPDDRRYSVHSLSFSFNNQDI